MGFNRCDTDPRSRLISAKQTPVQSGEKSAEDTDEQHCCPANGRMDFINL